MTKLEQFVKRNRKRNAHLYADGLVEGHDFIVCPVSNERLSMIKSSYIEKVLDLTVDEYDRLYPGIRGISEARKKNIKKGLQQIDPVTGKTKYEISQEKARVVLSAVDESGMSGYKKKGQKTRASHLSKIDQYGRNGYSQIATRAIIKGNYTKAKSGQISLNRSEFKRYKLVVLYLTEKYRKELTSGYISGLAGKDNAWHIDHRFSILKGFQQGVSPLVIGHVCNLQMIPWKENISKHSSCSLNLIELLDMCKYTKEQSDQEFSKICQLISSDLENNVPPNAAFLLERYYESTVCK